MATMAMPQPHAGPVGPDTLITCKVLIDGTNRRFKLALRDLGAHTLPQKLRFLLAIPPECEVQFDRYSDSAGTYISLDSTNPAVYKQLYRAAKAKLKLRLRASVVQPTKTESTFQPVPEGENTSPEQERVVNGAPRQSSYLETVLSHVPAPAVDSIPSSQSAASIPLRHPDTRSVPQLMSNKSDLSRATLPSLNDFFCNSYSIDCNACDKAIPNEHYHCSICEQGDFDLCQACMDNGVTCDGEDHWLIKRSIRNGRAFPSVTETFPPKTAIVDKSQPAPLVHEEEERTCNGCISQLSASSFVTCKDCPDFDLCFNCFHQGEHGHHPAHAFDPVEEETIPLDSNIRSMCEAGRGLRHDAICDGCEKHIVGVRHKCLTCPDFDYCSTCVKSAGDIHPNHRFAPLYEQLPAVHRYKRDEAHRGIFCDGPVCAARSRKSWIRGDRYKCAVCHDTDFCANCEASPTFEHNKSHPLIKIKTPIRFMSVSMIDEQDNVGVQLGDRPSARNASTETTRPVSINAATQVQTVAEVMPADAKATEESQVVTSEVKASIKPELQALFESDSTPDGSTFAPNHLVSQCWTIRNPGPLAWPAGCAVYFIGGDDMRNLDMVRPSSVSDMAVANRSNVLEEPLEPGKTAEFTVLLKSPPRECRAVSYWRLKTNEGLPFGNRLWVDITVARKPVQVSASAAPVPEPFEVEEVQDKSQQSSTMIFPKLEKESPESSIHDVAKSPSVATTTHTVTVTDDHDLIEDLENLELDEDATEDGFLTDEEYDILDADDEDFLEEAQRAVAQKK